MPRKSSKIVSGKKHTSVPPSASASKETPKKAAEVAKPAPAVPAASADSKAKTPAAVAPSTAVPVIAPAAEKTGNAAERALVAARIAALRNMDADVARDAATELGRLRDKSAVEPLIEALRNENDYFHSVVRAAAALSLAQLGDARAFEPLVNAVRDTMAEASAEAVRALAAMGDQRAVNVLIDIVRNPTGFFLPTVRLAAVVGLKQLGGAAARAELVRIAGDNSEDPAIREAAGR